MNTPFLAVVDTNVVISGLITAGRSSPSARILDGMLSGRLRFVVSVELLAEYRSVLLRPRICSFHGLTGDEVERIIRRLVESAILREPAATAEAAPDPGDQHLWDLLAATPGATLVTGDQALLRAPLAGHSTLSPRGFVYIWSG